MRLSEAEYEEHVLCHAGFCPACDDVTMRDGVEIDAVDYLCPDCGAKVVMGIETALMAGHLELGGEGDDMA